MTTRMIWRRDWEDDEDDEEEFEDDWLEEGIDEGDLTLEQQCFLRRLALEAQGMGRAELMQALLACWAERFMEQRMITETAIENGLPMRINGMALVPRPRTREDFKEIFGYVPSAQEAVEYLDQLEETATMELDMESIVDSMD